jgi:glutathione S-transferase
MRPILHVGNKNYSSWSLRGWLAMAWSGLDFDTRVVELDQPGYGSGAIAGVLALSPSGRVPSLDIAGATIWDSLAIAEWAAERAPQAGLWPQDATERALARSLASEMHSGFAAIRDELPCNIRRRSKTPPLSDAAKREIARIDAIFSAQSAWSKNRGPYLFGARGVVDAFYLPVATRLRTYAIPMSDAAARTRDALLADADFLRWESEGEAEWRGPLSRSDADSRHA